MVLYADIFEADTRTLLAIGDLSFADLRHEQVDGQYLQHTMTGKGANATADTT